MVTCVIHIVWQGRQPRYGKNPEAGKESPTGYGFPWGIRHWCCEMNTSVQELSLFSRLLLYAAALFITHPGVQRRNYPSIDFFDPMKITNMSLIQRLTNYGSEAPRTDSSSGTNPIPKPHPRDIVSSLPWMIREEVGLRYKLYGNQNAWNILVQIWSARLAWWMRWENGRSKKWKWERVMSQHFTTGIGRCRRMLCGLHKFL